MPAGRGIVGSGALTSFTAMRADQIQARAVAKVVLVALFWAGVAVLLAIALMHTRTTLQWVAAAVFLTLALDPAVGLIQRAWPGDDPMPRVLAILIVYLAALALLVFLVLHVFPPIVHDIEGLAGTTEPVLRQIGAMQPEELVAAIALPAKQVGLPIEEEQDDVRQRARSEAPADGEMDGVPQPAPLPFRVERLRRHRGEAVVRPPAAAARRADEELSAEAGHVHGAPVGARHDVPAARVRRGALGRHRVPVAAAGSATPISASRVISGSSVLSSQPSVPSGRWGRTM